MSLAIPFVLPFLLAFPPQDPPTVTLVGVDGDAVSAQVLELTADKVRLRVVFLGGQMTVVRRIADFTPFSQFRIEMLARPPVDFASHFAMARRAGDLGLLPQAGSEARLAVEAVVDPAERATRRVEVRTWAAATLEDMVREAVLQERVDDATHCLGLLSSRLPEMRTEPQLAALTAAVAELEDRLAAARLGVRLAKQTEAVRERTERSLGKIRVQLQKGDALARQAILKSGSTVASSRLCQDALDVYQAGSKALRELLEQNGDDLALAKEAVVLGQQLQDHGVRAAMHAASVMTVQSDYRGAMQWANSVLAFDPDNAEAKEMARTIQMAAAVAGHNWQWGWNEVGLGRGALDPRRR